MGRAEKPRREQNGSLLPFCAAAAVTAGGICALSGARFPALAGWFVLWFPVSFALWLLLFTAGLALTSLCLNTAGPQERYEPFFHGAVAAVDGILCALGRLRIHTVGMENLPEGRWLLVCNHRSGFDPLVAGWVLRGRRLSFILKPGVARLPIVGPFVYRACFLTIDRENDRAALKTILTAAKLMKGDVVSVGVFPEGTRNTGEGLLPFRNGAFKAAQRAGRPIVVTALRGTERIRRNFPWRPTDITFTLCGVLDAETAAGMNTAEIGEQARAWIAAEIG